MNNDIQPAQPMPPKVSIRPWTEGDLLLLQRMNTEEMWAHLGGPESDVAVIARHQRYLRAVPGKVRMFVILFGSEPAGNVGYWQRRWKEQDVYEAGWGVLPDFQGQGIATLATSEMLDILRTDDPKAVVHTFPSFDNPASNAICRKLGFSFLNETEFEFPPGSWIKCNDWRLVL
ncbi:GNAT family N-acetyltransferase [Cohnella luojiensis]|nr:GNAT family N-acetyltransferase [Cohnella luojiensis]